MSSCDCLSIQWKQNPTKTSPVLWLDTVRSPASNGKCAHQNLLCPNGWTLADYAENCWCDLCDEKICTDMGRCDENCGCKQWLDDPSEGTKPIVLAMRMEKSEPPRYTPVQQNADNEMHEGELEQEQDDLNASPYSPHGAESENSPLLPRNLGDRPMVERCANPDTGSVHVHRHSRSHQRTQLQQRVEQCANPDTGS